MSSIVSISGVRKTYGSGVVALDGIDLEIERGEILALLGPNGAGKTTLISTICGITSISAGRITVDGHDVVDDYRAARTLIGLVPQEIHLDIFSSVLHTVGFSRGLFGKAPDAAHVERLLRRLSLWEKRDAKIRQLSGGMMRRVLIAKALAHEPRVIFLDEPSAGVDVDLRRDMWAMVEELRAEGATIILTTHYIEEAEAIADRVGVIQRGKLLLVEDKTKLMSRMGSKRLTIELSAPLDAIPAALAPFGLTLGAEGNEIVYSYDRAAERTGIASLLRELTGAGIVLRDLRTEQDSLEDIFVHLVRGEPMKERPAAPAAPAETVAEKMAETGR